MARSDETTRRSFGPVTLLVAGAATLALWCAYDSARLASARDSHHTQVRQLDEMQQDAHALLRLRAKPRLATDRRKPNDELLAQVRDALLAAGVPPDRWIGNEPMPPARVPRAPYERLAMRLRLERLSMRQAVDTARHLVGHDPALTIWAARLTRPRHGETDNWDLVLTVSYLIYAPSG